MLNCFCFFFQHVFKHLHLQPKEYHNVDFSRVRMWSINGWWASHNSLLSSRSLFSCLNFYHYDISDHMLVKWSRKWRKWSWLEYCDKSSSVQFMSVGLILNNFKGAVVVHWIVSSHIELVIVDRFYIKAELKSSPALAGCSSLIGYLENVLGDTHGRRIIDHIIGRVV